MSRILSVLFIFGTVAIANAAEIRRLNIVLILADDLGYGDLAEAAKVRNPCHRAKL